VKLKGEVLKTLWWFVKRRADGHETDLADSKREETRIKQLVEQGFMESVERGTYRATNRGVLAVEAAGLNARERFAVRALGPSTDGVAEHQFKGVGEKTFARLAGWLTERWETPTRFVDHQMRSKLNDRGKAVVAMLLEWEGEE
jgi:hypothetical protein